MTKRDASGWNYRPLMRSMLLLGLLACHRPEAEQQTPAAGKSAPASLFSHAVIKNGKTYGYEVLFDGKPVIRQKTVPVQPMQMGFHDSLAAERVAELVEHRMAMGESPSITRKEMDSLGIMAQ